uniref:Uncharacterized protein n=1 Tax=Chenopodium quinoa TaxID=63459 RepID=A0A803MSZ6_CHEQI
MPDGVKENQWIERPSGKIPDEVAKRFAIPDGNSQNRWQPELDVCRNESIFTDDLLWGGNLGYRLLCNRATPVDRPAGLVGPVAAQQMHDLIKVVVSGSELVEMYRYYQEQHHQASLNQQTAETALKNSQKALDGIKAAKKKEDKELKALREKANKSKAAEDEIKSLCLQLEEKSKAIDQLPVVRKELDDAKGVIGLFKEKVQKMEADKPDIKQIAVSRYLRSTDFIKRLQNRYDSGWTAAQRCVVQQQFADEGLFNADHSSDNVNGGPQPSKLSRN